MEYRLNKIDPELRQRIKETTSTGKVHTKTGIAIDKDKHNKKNDDKSFKQELEKQKQKNKISVEAVKLDEVEVPVYKEEVESVAKEEEKGHILDIRK